jgi:hypothetical protein
MTINLKTLSITIWNAVMLSVVFYCYAECHYTECRYAECRGANHSSMHMHAAALVNGKWPAGSKQVALVYAKGKHVNT